ncbi:16S rRNA (cytosine967-C5)-methyltransferase [Brevibacterium sanguinis]|uniref:16S rRNA (Cytosine967-C5)-methyltransferase n=2 Tax=Brevibacterium TaxID=1696 RepID=A0A366IH37_9MICO|nr:MULTISPECIES: RsmB/NOP family class I SAM-dependent RNA methyltransferase [Brevibacterium]RBP61595.1 16S rRNA (cytosine967-C5)-methyltransferase [Brevibacterium sanguinis]RBP70847.1 16S rRNA (cytosine967-C5)-methyltransferase [Brevibacterium celere]
MATKNLPRRIAWEVLLDVATKDSYANLLLPAKLARTHLGVQDAALATELTYGALRQQELYDAVIARAARREVSTIDPEPLAALRLGAHQLLSMRIPDHAAVSETVAVVKANAPKAAGFTNAVLRRISETDRDDWLDRVTAGTSEVARQALEHSHPEWIIRAMTQALKGHGRSAGELVDLLEADNAAAKVTLTALPGLCERGELPGTPTRLSPVSVTLDTGVPGHIPAVAEGRARVQDEGSALVALALAHASAPEGTWADLCAGPGGKAALLGAVAGGEGTRLEAFDSSRHRAKLVRTSTQALPAVTTAVRDARDATGPYAKVLVDVPCSGLGALRRRPEARYRRTPADINALAAPQREILTAALDACAPGGIVAYSTCSPHYAETVLVVDDVLRRTPAEVLDAPDVLARITGADAAGFASVSRGDGRFAQLWPHVHGTDGMFLALLRKAHR